MRLTSAILLFSIALSFGSKAGAAEQQPKGKPNEDGVLVTAVWMDGTAAQGADLFISQTPEPAKIVPAVNRRSISVIVKLSPGGPIVLVSRPKVAPGKDVGSALSPATKLGATSTSPIQYYPAGQVSWPKGTNSRRILLLLATAPGPVGFGPQIRGIALPDDFESFPVHTIRVVNFTPQPLFMRVGEKVENLPTGLSLPVAYARFAQTGDKGVPNFPLALARVLKEGSSDVFLSTNGEGRAGTRIQLVVMPSADPAKPPTVMRLQDSAPISPSAVPKSVR